MLEPWNNAAIGPPPVMTHPCDVHLDLDGLQYICKEAKRVLTRQSPLHQEAAIISRFIYKFSRKFRNDLGFRSLKKVNTALKRYLSLDMVKIIEYLLNTIPSDDSEDLYAPSRQMLQFVLVRLQSFSKIMVRISICSKQACIFYLDRIKRAESHWMSLMPYAVLCRVWSMASVLLNHCCSWYGQLYQFNSQLHMRGMAFLPDNYSLPTVLSHWLGTEDLDEIGRFNWAVNKQVVVLPFIEDDNEKDSFDIFKYVEKVNESEPTPTETRTFGHGFAVTNKNNLVTDHGEFIPRESLNLNNVHKDVQMKQIPTFESDPKLNKLDVGTAVSRLTKEEVKNEPNEERTVKDIKCIHSPDSVTNSHSLKKFLSEEESHRHTDSELSRTKHLSFMQFMALKMSLTKLITSENCKMKRKFQKIWKEKCLDYLT